MDYVLLHRCNSDFYLMRLDLPNFKCTFMDKYTPDTKESKFIFDYKNRRHFCVLHFDGDQIFPWLTHCQIEDTILACEERFWVDWIFRQLICVRLEGNHVQALLPRPQSMEFGEYRLVAGNRINNFQRLFYLDQPVDLPSLNVSLNLQF
jgi:hypothetical protein